MSNLWAGEPSGARFCNGCGAPLETAPAGALEERRIVTVLFADMAGFTMDLQSRLAKPTGSGAPTDALNQAPPSSRALSCS